MEEKLKAFLEYAKAGRRLCPMAALWNELWDTLPEKKRVGAGWEPSLPLTLAAWDSPHVMKILRLEEHILNAEHGALDEVNSFLRNFKTEQWLYR